jgi:predicted dehydrogenase
MTTVHWGILGGGSIVANAMAPALSTMRNGRLVALASTSRERGAALARDFGIGTLYYDYSRLLDDSSVDAVYLALPNSLHRDWAIAALQAGKHVLCEKPLALDEEQGREMAAAAAAGGRLLMEAFMYRFNRTTSAFVEGVHGDVRHTHVSFASVTQDPSNIRLRPELGGGALLDLGCYAIDAARWIMGEPETVAAAAQFRNGVDVSVAIALAFPGGGMATLWASFDGPPYQELTVTTDADTFRLGPVGGDPVGRRPFSAWFDARETSAIEPYRLMAEAFAEAVTVGTQPPLPLTGSLANLRVIDKVRRAARITAEPATDE